MERDERDGDERGSGGEREWWREGVVERGSGGEREWWREGGVERGRSVCAVLF
jgi:hypothetical protein